MLKKYISKSCISINVCLSGGGKTHVSFSPLTGGGSVYYTDNASIQAGLERHPKYGKLFKEDDTVSNVVAKPQIDTRDNIEDSPADAGDDAAGSDTDALKDIVMACNDDAKDYLAERYGISRSKLRSRQAIDAAGLERGIRFVWQ